MVNLVGDSAVTTTPAVKGTNTANGVGVYGVNNTSSLHVGPCGVQGDSTHGIGVYGTSSDWYAVYGEGGIVGVRGVCYSTSGYGVEATSTGATSYGLVANSPYQGINTNCTGSVAGSSAIAAFGGITCISASTNVSGATCISGNAIGGAVGVYGESGSIGGKFLGPATGVLATVSGTGTGTSAVVASGGTVCISASTTVGGAIGIYGQSSSGIGISGASIYAGLNNAVGVYGAASSGSSGRGGQFTGSYCGVYATSTGSYSIYSTGSVYVGGLLTKAGGGFKIDHPQDPENKYLYHGFVESPEASNLYKGTVVLDDKGGAEVALPAYFEAANSDFVYQLTAIGAAAPDLHVSKEISGNKFGIAGGKASMKISWTITATRSDKWAKANHPGTEIDKGADKGFFMHPELFGHGKDKSVHPHDREPKIE